MKTVPTNTATVTDIQDVSIAVVDLGFQDSKGRRVCLQLQEVNITATGDVGPTVFGPLSKGLNYTILARDSRDGKLGGRIAFGLADLDRGALLKRLGRQSANYYAATAKKFAKYGKAS